MKDNIYFLGIDVGGAHLKLVGINKKAKVCLVSYEKCFMWKGINELKKQITKINTIIHQKNTICGITMTGELCDIFKNRELGAKSIIKECSKINCKKYYYSSSKEIFSIKPKINKIISMNWHSIGRLMKSKTKNAVIVDFGSTTTDFICIKNHQIQNKNFDDYSRIINNELIYTGVTRTPIFGIANKLKFGHKPIKIIPEFFSNTSDVYRVLGKIKKDFDLEDTADNKAKTLNCSLKRIARNFGLDYNPKIRDKLITICEKLADIQLEQINRNINFLFKKFSLPKATLIITSGIGQSILNEFLLNKNMKSHSMFEFFSLSKKFKTASYHAPAFAIAKLLIELKIR